jgi:riboflavin synthase
MFTGIIEELATVVEAGERLVVRAVTVLQDGAEGASIAVNGCCLTVVERTRDGSGASSAGSSGTLRFDLSPETLARTSLGGLASGDPVNLERPVTLLTRLGGHLVQGHVDGVGVLVSARDAGEDVEMTFEGPAELFRYIAEKGSIAVDGISLTVASVAAPRFDVALIPFTLKATTLGARKPGDPVNLEVDVMAKYVESLLGRTM